MDQIEEIKNQLDIVDVIKDYIKLEKAGQNYRAPCPFHSEKKPSFFVSQPKQIWKCFGCGKGGDVFGFVKEIEGVEFREALEILAKKAGVTLKRLDPKQVSRDKRLYDICEIATKFFEQQLEKSKAGKKARQYLVKERGISNDSLIKWRVGYSPDIWRSLTDYLASCGFQRNEIAKVGLGIINEKGNFYDRFRGRIIFPIFDLHSRVVGFSGRVFKEKDAEKTAKYVNTPNTPLYNKSNIIFGLDKSKVAIRKENACIIAEGYTDVILSHQVGVKNIVAASGTAFTNFQLNILKRYTKNLVFAFDMDSAGDAATKRGIGLAQTNGFDIKVLIMPGSHDPADVIAENPDKWSKIIKEARDVLEFFFEKAFEKFDAKTPNGKKEIAKELLPVIKRIPNAIVRFHWIEKLAENLHVTQESVEKELAKVPFQKEARKQQVGIKTEEGRAKDSEREKKQTRQEMLEDQLLSFFLQEKKGIDLLQEEDMRFFSTDGLQLFSALKKHEVDLEKLKEDLSPALFQKIQIAGLKIEVMGEVDSIEEEAQKTIQRMKNLYLKKQLEALSLRIREAEKAGDDTQVQAFTHDFNKISKQI